MKQKFSVTGMTCAACSAHVENSVKKLNGVQSVAVSLLTNSMTVQYDEQLLSAQQIIQAVQSGGYGASTTDSQQSKGINNQPSGVTLSRLISSLALCLVLMYVSMGHMIGLPLPGFLSGVQNAVSFALIQLLLCLPVWYINRSYYIVGFKRLFKGSPNMDSLIAVGSSAGAIYAIIIIFVMSNALGLGDIATVQKYHHQLYFESSAMILALVDLGKYFEGKSKQKTGNALAKLKNLAPKKALLLQDGIEVEVDSSTIVVGNVVVVKAGMVFPADGVVTSGSCFADESAISGESMAVEKLTDSKVIGGTLCVGGYVQVTVTTVGEDSVLSKIITLVEEASGSKAPIQRLADKISSVFVPIVLSISLVTLIIWLIVSRSWFLSLDFAISVLVISCPCALGLATPVALMVATGKGAEHGILIKNGEVLEHLAQLQCVVLDKTGTLTEGKPQVKDFYSTMDSNTFFAIIGGIEQQSEHPLGNAVVAHAQQMGISLVKPTDFKTIAGQGVVATVDGKSYAIGNKLLMQQQGVENSTYQNLLDQYLQKAYTCLLVSCNGAFVGIVGVGDQVKQTSKQAIECLDKLNIKTVLLTGDNQGAAQSVCNEVGITECITEVLPHQKQQHIATLKQSYYTAMVGDGINDAPALATADIGFSVASGSDIAIDSASVVLVKNDIRDVATAVELSKKTVKNIKQNLFWAFFYNALGIPIAAGVLYNTPLNLQLSPMLAALAMSMSSLFVVTNALRLRFFKPSHAQNKQCNQGCTLPTNPTQITTQEENTMTYQLSITGMMCPHCTGRVQKTLEQIPGVTQVEVSLEKGTATVQCANVEQSTLVNAVTEQGYPVTEIVAL